MRTPLKIVSSTPTDSYSGVCFFASLKPNFTGEIRTTYKASRGQKIPAIAAKKVTEKVTVPTIGIGAGPYCDGQILVTHDILGLFEKFRPKFVRVYAEIGREIREACARYSEDVKVGSFPSQDESY